MSKATWNCDGQADVACSYPKTLSEDKSRCAAKPKRGKWWLRIQRPRQRAVCVLARARTGHLALRAGLVRRQLLRAARRALQFLLELLMLRARLVQPVNSEQQTRGNDNKQETKMAQTRYEAQVRR
eukprot:2034290-Pleurochrysis_carterae.AAC.2